MLRTADFAAQKLRGGDIEDTWPQTILGGDYMIALGDREVGNIMLFSRKYNQRICQMIVDGITNKAVVEIPDGQGGNQVYEEPTPNACPDNGAMMIFYPDDVMNSIENEDPEDPENPEDSKTTQTETTTTETTTETTTTVEFEEPEADYCGWTDWINNDHPSTNSTGDDIETFNGVCKPENVKDIKCVAAVEPYLPWETLGQKQIICNIDTGFICKANEQFGNGPFEVCYDYKIKVYCCKTKPWDYLPE